MRFPRNVHDDSRRRIGTYLWVKHVTGVSILEGQNLPVQSLWRGKSLIILLCNLSITNSVGGGAKLCKIVHLGVIALGAPCRYMPGVGTSFKYGILTPQQQFYQQMYVQTPRLIDYLTSTSRLPFEKDQV